MRHLWRVGALAVALTLCTGLPAIAARKSGSSLPVETLTCGEVLDHSVQMAGDLDCTSSGGTAGLYINDVGIVLDLGGHDLILGASQVAGVSLSHSSGSTVRNGRILLDSSDEFTAAVRPTIDDGSVSNLTISGLSIIGTGSERGLFLDTITNVKVDQVTVRSVYIGIHSRLSSVTISNSSVVDFAYWGFDSQDDISWTGSYLTATAAGGVSGGQLGFRSAGTRLYDLRYSKASGASGNPGSAGLDLTMGSDADTVVNLLNDEFTSNWRGMVITSGSAFYNLRSTIKGNVAQDNFGDGFLFVVMTANYPPMSITGNRADRNGVNGIEVLGGADCVGSPCPMSLSQNEARSNGEYGFTSARRGVSSSRNAVYRNTGLLILEGQCFNVDCYLLKK